MTRTEKAERRQKAINRVIAGESIEAVAADVGLSPATLEAYVDDATSLPVYKRAQRRKDAIRKILEGVPTETVAKETGLSVGYLRNLARKKGAPRKRRSDRGGSRKKRAGGKTLRLVQYVLDHPEITRTAIAKRFHCSRQWVSEAVKRCSVLLKPTNESHPAPVPQRTETTPQPVDHPVRAA